MKHVHLCNTATLILLFWAGTTVAFFPAFRSASALNHRTPFKYDGEGARSSCRPVAPLAASPLLDESTPPVTAEGLFAAMDADGSGSIDEGELRKLLLMLEIDFNEAEVSALFAKLDVDGSGQIDRDEFQVWFEGAFATELDKAASVYNAVMGRRTVHAFEPGVGVPDQVLRKAITAATMAPNHRLTEPWRFHKLGPLAVAQVAALNAASIEDPAAAQAKEARWAAVPGWLVVTSGKATDGVGGGGPGSRRFLEDYAATCCAIQNFNLVLWADGVGTKWTTGDITRTPEFADICGIDSDTEEVVGCLWYGYPKGDLDDLPAVARKRSLKEVLFYTE